MQTLSVSREVSCGGRRVVRKADVRKPIRQVVLYTGASLRKANPRVLGGVVTWATTRVE